MTRRTLLTAAVAGAGGLFVPRVAGDGPVVPTAVAGSATEGWGVITRTIGRTGERLPAVGLGAALSAGMPAGARAQLRDVLMAYRKAGGRVIDTSQLDGDAELAVSAAATSLGIARDMFWTRRIPATAEDLSGSRLSRRSRASRTRPRPDRADVMQVHNLADAEAAVPMLGQWKSAGRVRYVGISHHATRYYPAIEILIRNFDVDVVHIRYSISTRLAEERILPLAAERGVGVIATMPMERGRLHKLVEGHRVPGWAAEFDATTWAQFFLKYVLAHPAVTIVLQSTGNLAHLAENLRVLRGPLPDDAQRARMVTHMAGFAGFDRLENES